MPQAGARDFLWIAFKLLSCLAFMLADSSAHAQRADEDVIAEAPNAFGTTVGRQSIGLYSASSARGFNPMQAGNLRIDGLYFDAGNNFSSLSTRVARRTAVSVGIAAQDYVFAAPTGIVDKVLRIPGANAALSELVGYGTYGQVYAEADGEMPLLRGALSMGAGVGYTHNIDFDGGEHSSEWTTGWIARWRPAETVQITPFWDRTDHWEQGEKPYDFIGTSGIPRYYPISAGGQSWASFDSISSDFGTIARISLANHWNLSIGLFRALQVYPENYDPDLAGMNSLNQGDYSITAVPATSNGSTSGEIRASKDIETASLRSSFQARFTFRDSSIESGPGDTRDFGTATVTAIPQLPMPDFSPGAVNDVAVRQFSPGVAYEGELRGRARLTLSLQKVLYHRVVSAPATPTLSQVSAPLLYHAALAFTVTRRLLAYGSFTQGFEEIGTAPLNAVNRFEPAPAQVSKQVDAGWEYQLHSNLQLIGGIFSIQKPYFSVDQSAVFRELGHMRNQGVELSLVGQLTRQLHVVSGVALIKPELSYLVGARSGPSSAVAVGPAPGYMTTSLEYHVSAVAGLVLGSSINTYSSRYAEYPAVELPPTTAVNAQVRYQTTVLGHQSTILLRGSNLTDAHVLFPNPSGAFGVLDARRFDLSFEMDI